MTVDSAGKADVLILGGGLAGLTLALQLKQNRPDRHIVVIEKRAHPAAAGAHKVGESTVEIGAHYFAEVLGLKQHLTQDQLLKFGLRFFFGGPDSPRDLAEHDEIGPSQLLPVDSYQIDRGTFENYLLERARTRGIEVFDNALVANVAPGTNASAHAVTVRTDAIEQRWSARWLVDAAGRSGLLKRHFGLERATPHRNCAVWFRTTDDISIDTWSSSNAWRERCGTQTRRQSTNHLMGPGYWVWVIPLASGATSVGVVFDPDLHTLQELGNYDRVIAWLQRNQPIVAAALQASSGEILDFHVLRNYPHSCRSVFSADRWALTGEAGVFADPFYSPGSDFIALSNTLVAELIDAEMRGEDIAHRVRRMQQMYFSFFSSTLSLFTGQYPGFGDRDLMYAKTVWDYVYYWAIFAKLFFSGRLTDFGFIDRVQKDLLQAFRLNTELQLGFGKIAAMRRSLPAAGHFYDQYRIPWFYELKQQLTDELVDPGVQIGQNIARLGTVATSLRSGLQASLQGQYLTPERRINGL